MNAYDYFLLLPTVLDTGLRENIIPLEIAFHVSKHQKRKLQSVKITYTVFKIKVGY